MLVSRYRPAAEALEAGKSRMCCLDRAQRHHQSRGAIDPEKRGDPAPGMTCSTNKERRGNQEEKFPELAEAQAQMDDAPPAGLETEHMNQSAILLR